MNHILGIVGSAFHNLDTGKTDYAKIQVTDDIIEWLNSHDTKRDAEGSTIYVCNSIEYIYLGMETSIPLTKSYEA